MTRLLTLPRMVTRNPIPGLLRLIAHHLRMRREIRDLGNLPSERLEDMGIKPSTSANLRSSGEMGKVPQMPLW